MTFLSPLVLIGLFGALVPLIIHLLFRKKPQLRTLPTLMFVRLANQKCYVVIASVVGCSWRFECCLLR